MNLYSYYFFEGDEGVVIAHSWEEAKELVEKEYGEFYGEKSFKVVYKITDYNDGNCLLYSLVSWTDAPFPGARFGYFFVLNHTQ